MTQYSVKYFCLSSRGIIKCTHQTLNCILKLILHKDNFIRHFYVAIVVEDVEGRELCFDLKTLKNTLMSPSQSPEITTYPFPSFDESFLDFSLSYFEAPLDREEVRSEAVEGDGFFMDSTLVMPGLVVESIGGELGPNPDLDPDPIEALKSNISPGWPVLLDCN